MKDLEILNFFLQKPVMRLNQLKMKRISFKTVKKMKFLVDYLQQV